MKFILLMFLTLVYFILTVIESFFDVLHASVATIINDLEKYLDKLDE